MPRLGILGIRFNDGLSGVVMPGAIAFPVSMARGATSRMILTGGVLRLFRRNMQRSTASDYVCRANLPVTVLFWLHATSQPTRSGMTNVARTLGLTVLVKSAVIEGA